MEIRENKDGYTIRATEAELDELITFIMDAASTRRVTGHSYTPFDGDRPKLTIFCRES